MQFLTSLLPIDNSDGRNLGTMSSREHVIPSPCRELEVSKISRSRRQLDGLSPNACLKRLHKCD